MYIYCRGRGCISQIQANISSLMQISGARIALPRSAVRVSFIPNPAHISYVELKAVHPMRIVSYFLKTLVRPVDEMELL